MLDILIDDRYSKYVALGGDKREIEWVIPHVLLPLSMDHEIYDMRFWW